MPATVTRPVYPRIVFLLLALLPGFGRPTPTLQAGEASAYDQKIAAAKAFAAESHWGEARGAYAEALPLAPDKITRDWCELWLKTIPQSPPLYWPRDAKTVDALPDFFATRLKPFENGVRKNEDWVRLTMLRADFVKDREEWAAWRRDITNTCYTEYDWDSTHETNETRVSWNDYLDIADYLSTQPVSPQSTHRYVDWLQKTVELFGIVNRSAAAERMRAHLAAASKREFDSEDTAWCALAHARAMCEDARMPLGDRDSYWSRAIDVTAGTSWENIAHNSELVWRMRKSIHPLSSAAATMDLASTLETLKKFVPKNAPTNTGALPGDPYTPAELLRRFSAPVLHTSVAQMVPRHQPVLVNITAANISALTATLTRLPWDPAANALLPETEQTANVPVILRQWTVPLPDPRFGIWNTLTIEAATDLPPGSYELDLTVAADPKTKSAASDPAGVRSP